VLGSFGIEKKSSASPKRSAVDADIALVSRIVAGDLRAFEALYRIYYPRLERFLSLMTARHSVVEEALNDTMYVVWRRAETYNHQSKVSTWIFAIAYRTALKALRHLDEPVELGPDHELPSDDGSPEQLLMTGQTRSAVLKALDALSPEQRSALVLTYFHDLPYAEIAHIVDCPVDTVKTRVFHGRRRLRAMLQDDLGKAS